MFVTFFFQTVKTLCPGLEVFTQSELLLEFHRLLKFGFLEGITLFSTAYETQLRKKKAEEQINEVDNPQESTWSGSSVKISGPRYYQKSYNNRLSSSQWNLVKDTSITQCGSLRYFLPFKFYMKSK